MDVLFSRARREAVEWYNEEVRQIREMLKNIVNAVLYLARQEMAFRRQDESSISLTGFLSGTRLICVLRSRS